jgi:hypothetical protein
VAYIIISEKKLLDYWNNWGEARFSKNDEVILMKEIKTQRVFICSHQIIL